jgi:large subunit ribosomal protein L15
MPLIRRIPKRGFNNAEHRVAYLPINVDSLAGFAAGTVVDEAALRACGLLRGKADGVKILGDGEIDRRLVVHAHAFSASARSKIVAAGGECHLIEKVKKPARAKA